MNNSGDDDIIAEVLNGNVNAFGLLVKKYQKPIYNLMLRMTGSPDRAEDLTQDTFIRVYDKIDLFKPGKNFFSWIYKIGMNLARDSIRKNARMLRVLDDEKNMRLLPSMDPEADQWVEMEGLLKALEELPWMYREVIILRYRYDFSMKEIARTLKISISGVKMRIHRGLKKLNDILVDK